MNLDRLQQYETGHGVYLLQPEVELVGNPRNIRLDLIPGTFQPKGDQPSIGVEDKAIRHLLSFSGRHNAWVGVEFGEFVKQVRAEENGISDAVINVVPQLIAQGLMFVPRKWNHKALRWLNHLEPDILCPTQELVTMVVRHQVDESNRRVAMGVAEKEFDRCMGILSR